MVEMKNRWIISGKVYDLSNFIDTHPGGRHILLLNEGRDCTELFFSYHIPSNKHNFIESKLEEFYVRDLTESELSQNKALTPFVWDGKFREMYFDLKSRVISHFKSKNTIANTQYDRKYYKANNFHLFCYALFLVALIITHYYWFKGYYITIPILAILHWYYSGDVTHCGTHYEIFRNPILNDIIAITGGFYFSPTLLWESQHVISHHSYTNIHKKDADLYHFRPWWRSYNSQRYQPEYRYWRYFIWTVFFASIGHNLNYISGFWVTGNKVDTRMTPYYKTLNMKDNIHRIFIAQMVWLWVLLPLFSIYCMGVHKGLLFIVLTRAINGAQFYVISQINHVQQDAFDEEHQGDIRSKNWIIHQIGTCLDYSMSSHLWSFISVGLNNQVIHHLFPSIHPCHYVDLNPLLEQFCIDHQIKRILSPNLFQALLSHIKHITKINDN